MSRARRGSGGGTPPDRIKVLSDLDLSPEPADMWGPFRPQWIGRKALGVEALSLGFGQIGAHLADLPRWHCDAVGRWHRV